MKKAALLLALLLTLTSCSKDEYSTTKDIFTSDFGKDKEAIGFRGRKLALNEIYFKISGANGNFYDQDNYSILYGFEYMNSEAIEDLFDRIFINLSFWKSSKYRSENTYTILKDDRKQDLRILQLKLDRGDYNYMKIAIWEEESTNYFLVVGKDKREVNKVFDEIFI